MSRCRPNPDEAVARQARIANGVLVLIGAALTWFVHRYWVVWLVFMGVSLIFSGLVGYCGWAAILRRMPWNRTSEMTAEHTADSAADATPTKSCDSVPAHPDYS